MDESLKNLTREIFNAYPGVERDLKSFIEYADNFLENKSHSYGVSDLKNLMYVYFLYEDVRIVYVGKTANLRNRLSNHQVFDENKMTCKYILVQEGYVDFIEHLYILIHTPKYNKQIPESIQLLTLENYISTKGLSVNEKLKILRTIKNNNIENIHGYFLLSEIDDVENFESVDEFYLNKHRKNEIEVEVDNG